MPVMPQNEAGCRMEPPVSVAVAPMASRAATEAADPPEEPPGTRSAPSARCHGLRTGPKAEVMFDEPMANSSRFALPRNTAPSRSRCAVTVLS